MYVHADSHVCVYIYTCKYIHVYLYMYVCMHAYIYMKYTCTCLSYVPVAFSIHMIIHVKFKFTSLSLHIHMYTCVCMCLHDTGEGAIASSPGKAAKACLGSPSFLRRCCQQPHVHIQLRPSGKQLEARGIVVAVKEVSLK